MTILGTLEVRLHHAKHLKNVDFFIGRNDPYAIVSYNGQKQKSKTLKDSGSGAVWNQSFFFEVEEAPADVMIKVFDEDKHTADDIIGEARIPLGNVLTELVVPSRTYDLVGSLSPNKRYGEIEVSLKFVHKALEKPHIVPRSLEKPYIVPRTLHHHHYYQHHNGNSNQNRRKFDGPYDDINEEGGWK